MDALVNKRQQPSSYFYPSVYLLAMAYLIFEYFFIPYSALSADEFVFAKHIKEYTHHLPYRDFPPYKTILGYYLLSIPMYFSESFLNLLFYIKYEIAVINAACLIAASHLLCKYFKPSAVIFTMLAMIMNLLFLVYSSDLRVDMLSVWSGIFAAYLILDNKPLRASLMLALGFLISQKVYWFFGAANIGLFVRWAFVRHTEDRFTDIIKFNLLFILIIVCYAAFWSYLSSPAIVFQNLFYEAYITAQMDTYLSVYGYFWAITIFKSPAIFLLAPLALISMFEKQAENKKYRERIFTLSFSFSLLFLFLTYKQPFPYNFVFVIPAFLLLYADFFSYVLTSYQQSIPPQFAISSYKSRLLLYFYVFGIITILMLLTAPPLTSITALIPMSFYAYFHYLQRDRQKAKKYLVISLALFILMGMIYPIYYISRVYVAVNGVYQQEMLITAEQITTQGGEYIAGVPYLYLKEQSVPGLKNLIGPSLDYLEAPTDTLRQYMLPSLYLSVNNATEVLADLKLKPIKFFINNYRMRMLTDSLYYYLQDNYLHYYGSIYTYAPQVTPKENFVNLKFADQYRILTRRGNPILLDQQQFANGTIVDLKQGLHSIHTTSNLRLQLIPKAPHYLNPKFLDDHSERALKATVL